MFENDNLFIYLKIFSCTDKGFSISTIHTKFYADAGTKELLFATKK
jgi:hypothetical protein